LGFDVSRLWQLTGELHANPIIIPSVWKKFTVEIGEYVYMYVGE
jgi:hypothetical protein